MPSIRPVGEHTPRLTAVDETTDATKLVCQCGWEHALTDDEAWGSAEAWREIAAAHSAENS